MAAAAEQWTVGGLLETAGSYLREKGSASGKLDAELLLAEALGLDRIHVYTQYDRPLSGPEVDSFRALVARRAAHEPIAYILGRAHFRKLTLSVGPSVLIPRPETEELVEAALRLVRLRPPLGTSQEPAVADVGTGSGAIALSLAKEAGLRVLAIDASAEALAVAEGNAMDLDAGERIEFVQADLLESVPDGSLHLVVSNPPYVSSAEMQDLAPDVREYEPEVALWAGDDGLQVIRRLLPEAARALGPGGSVLLEVGHTQAEAVQELAREEGFALVSAHRDMSGKDRIVEATLPGAAEAPLGTLAETRLDALRDALQAGAIVGVPTDTVYGLAACWDSPTGVRGLFIAKGRTEKQIVAALFASMKDVLERLPDLDERAATVMASLLPGPYTFIVSTMVPRVPLVGTADSLGVRVPDYPALLGLIESLGTPLAATSANLAGRPAAATVSEVDSVVLAHCSVALTPGSVEEGSGTAGKEGAQMVTGSASTVVDLRPLADGAAPLVIREGAVSAADVLERISGALGAI